MEVFSNIHWDAILAQVDSKASDRNKRAEKLWARGYDFWLAQKKEQAKQLFEASVLEDPGLADGYLGLYALDENNENVCLALAYSALKIGECQRRLDRKLQAYYCPLFYEAVAITSADDARLALVRYLSKNKRVNAAPYWLERCVDLDTRTLALQARLALLSKNWNSAIHYCGQIALLDDELYGDAFLGLGLAFEGMGEYSQAAESYRHSSLFGHDQAREYARYRLEGAINLQRNPLTLSLPYGERDRPKVNSWEMLLAELQSGRVADSPEIPDNKN